MILALAACTEEPDHLIGNWRAVDISEQGDSMRLVPAEVTFNFLDNSRYRYTSTLRYEEAGTYRLQDNYLVARDTTRPGSTDRIVEVELLNADSLRLKMREADKERRLLFLKE
ncbi:hypothetical protein CEQ90_14455 [Lewinellaceae bacterium SD302]|nr:hypothetical protein CEQ90_14455 [Lewinellaceae bacterium SD302]